MIKISKKVLLQLTKQPVYENGTVTNSLIGKPLKVFDHYYFENRERKGGHNIVFQNKNNGKLVYFRLREFIINDIIDKNNKKYQLYDYLTEFCKKSNTKDIDFNLLPIIAIKTIDKERFYDYAIPNYKHITFRII